MRILISLICSDRNWDTIIFFLLIFSQIDCGDPGAGHNTDRELTITTLNSTVQYSCHTGHSLVSGDLERTCQNDGTWSGSNPTCDPIQCPDPNTNATITEGSSPYTYNTTVYFSCPSGSALGSNVTFVTCLEDGAWSDIIPACYSGCFTASSECDPVTCPQPADIANGSYAGSVFHFPHAITYSCDLGFVLSDISSVRSCQANGTWNGSEPVCNPIFCTKPELNSSVLITYESFMYRYGEQVKLECEAGYVLISGNLTLTCDDNSSWRGYLPICDPVICPEPNTNATITEASSPYIYNETVHVSCPSGSVRGTDVKSVTCLENGTWSDDIPLCYPGCYPLPTVDHASHDGSPPYQPTSMISYTCDNGYLLSTRSSQRICQSDGSWSGEAPV